MHRNNKLQEEMNEELFKTQEDKLTSEDIDVLSGMIIIFLHSAERCLQLIELAKEDDYRIGADYKRYVKLYGKAHIDNIVKKKVKEIVRGEQRLQLGKLLEKGKEFHLMMKKISQAGMVAHREDVTDADAFDAIIHDTNVLCYMYALMGNCLTDEDEMKLISTIKVLAKGNRVSDRIISRLEPK